MWCKFGHKVVTFPSEPRGTKPAYFTVRYPDVTGYRTVKYEGFVPRLVLTSGADCVPLASGETTP